MVKATYIVRIAVSIGISLLVLGLMFGFIQGQASPDQPTLFKTVRSASLPLLGIYLACQVLQASLRAWRYRVLLQAGGEDRLPGPVVTLFVTLARNMLVDLFPARLGELSYIGLMNRGYQVSGKTCVSSMTVSLLLDFAALFALSIVVLIFPMLGKYPPQLLVMPILAAGLATVAGSLVIFIGIKVCVRWVEKLFGRPIHFLRGVSEALDATRNPAALIKAFTLSLGVRLFKYGGLYFAFLAVVKNSFPAFATLPVWGVCLAFLASEGAASLPIPAFMSFGTYEAGGLAAFTLLKMPAAEAATVVLSVHLLSQVIDYALGGLSLILFTVSLPRSQDAQPATRKHSNRNLAAGALLALVAGAAFFAFEYRGMTKQGALTPPPPGTAIPIEKTEHEKAGHLLTKVKGFIVWSSNRFGNHDILKMTIPDFEITRLTKHPHVDYYPRISPDGSKIVFSRSQIPWVSQRNPLPWDVYLLDLASGHESLVATNGNTPSWSADGAKVYFQRNFGNFIEHDLASGQENILAHSGTPPVPAKVQLQTPEYNSRDQALAVTLRGGKRETALYYADGRAVPVRGGDSCMLSWSRDYRSLYYVGHGGKQKNAIYLFDPQTREHTFWLDLPEPYSHEYFPRLSNDSRYLVLAASTGDHEHDTADYEIFVWQTGTAPETAARITFHTGNDCWPDMFVGE